MNENPPKSFKDTLNLPQTDFPIRAQASTDDAALLERWQKADLYAKTFTFNAGKKKFILHDGPPYANGHLHLGHAYNKILKDMITKSKRMAGYHVPVIPGWDCHGLPIELKVTQEFPGLDRVALQKQCRAYAQHWIDVQKEEFKKLGVLFNWDKPYITMDPDYEATTIRAFGVLFKQGYIEKKKKTVAWCFHDQTVLASAEIEYKDRKDPSLYVLFPLTDSAKQQLLPKLHNADISLVLWTTTPWTLPMNRAVLVKPDATYDVLAYNDRYIMVGSALSDKVCSLLQIEKKVVATLNAQQLAKQYAHHPFIDSLQIPIIADQSVSLEDGTALVHCAPGCGPQDYDVALKHGLEVYSAINPDGTYDATIVPQDLIGKSVTEAQGLVIKKLQEHNRLLYKSSITHSYPHCWRCQNGLIFRATSQWFCSLEQHDLKKRALEAIASIQFLPPRSINFLKATIEGRLEWCLSRQRVWGTPIPALLCSVCQTPYITLDLIEKVARGVEQHGIEYWNTVSVEELSQGMVCDSCDATTFHKEQDILDVWFDSGISHYAVLYDNKEQAYPASIYVEGIDQHRGWFQSSLLTSLIIEQESCTQRFLTHGFTVDEKGHKMSKSLGNVISPDEIIKQLGTDGLRLWVSSIDYEGDAVVSQTLLRNIAEVYRKIRNTARFLLSNLYDFNKERDALALSELALIDRLALEQLCQVDQTIRDAYEAYDFTKVFHVLSDYCASTLSSTYLDIIKDRLYVEKADGKARRSAQTVCWYILDTLTKLMAPILSFTAELVSDHYQRNKIQSIHLQLFADLTSMINELAREYETLFPELVERHGSIKNTVAYINTMIHKQQWPCLLQLRSALLKAIEELREKSVIKHSLEAQLFMYATPGSDVATLLHDLKKRLKHSSQTLEQFLKELLIVSQITIVHEKQNVAATELTDLFARVEHAAGTKCPRCWQWQVTQHPDGLCDRCAAIV